MLPVKDNRASLNGDLFNVPYRPAVLNVLPEIAFYSPMHPYIVNGNVISTYCNVVSICYR